VSLEHASPGRVRLGILATHPIQYYAPLYRALACRPGIDLTVYFAHRPTPEEQGVGFGVPFAWDADLTSGYHNIFLTNCSRRPNRDRFWDYHTPAIRTIVTQGGFNAFLVHGWQTRAYWQAMAACWRAGIPVYVRGDSQLRDDASSLKRAVKRLVYPRFVGRFRACLSVGVRSDAYFRYYGARRVVRSPHFVDNALFAERARTARARRAAIRAAWGIGPDTTVALFAGKLIDKKRPGDLLAAAARANATHTTPSGGIHVLVAGDGPLRTTCEEAALALGVPTTFAGFLNQSEMPKAYAAADVLVLPSDRQETWGLVVNEAMASGLPAIVSDAAGCVSDLIVAGETGYAYPAGNVEALADALRAIRASGRAAEMGRAASERVRDYSVDRAADGVLEAVTT
jgi:glycosyltransferase involved in cell wall biosynthesis